jgi:hypothetical protein
MSLFVVTLLVMGSRVLLETGLLVAGIELASGDLIEHLEVFLPDNFGVFGAGHARIHRVVHGSLVRGTGYLILSALRGRRLMSLSFLALPIPPNSLHLPIQVELWEVKLPHLWSLRKKEQGGLLAETLVFRHGVGNLSGSMIFSRVVVVTDVERHHAVLLELGDDFGDVHLIVEGDLARSLGSRREGRGTTKVTGFQQGLVLIVLKYPHFLIRRDG